MPKEINPCAFPLTAKDDDVLQYGMTLRGYFACGAMQALVSNPKFFQAKNDSKDDRYNPFDGYDPLAQEAYLIADSMLTERGVKEG